ncbi:hypothetical protein [Paenibacillus harenae]|uniref:hypothetical protein n=1 Tax=Paenibacillus harenae TaxID=306543 RepID=UPI002793B982|nr:hypothetical protein [Paenibacillus harenae]MDQ0060468.1 hypothetical protein [Paenibacillus harenae]
MKNILSILLTILLSSLLFACSSEGVKATFIGTIEEMNGDSAPVYVDEGDILSSGKSVYVDLSVNSEATFEVGDKIKVGYDGTVRETSPLGIDTLSVLLVE